ncbi:hypothetical protein [Streptomyces collinus]|uniref:hypothetical protein n=1 Tax=Streptomyces collinus TaxID=42684 RepID=UPI00362AC337
MDNGDTCQHLEGREVDGPSGQRTWVQGIPCGKPALVRAPGRAVCPDHITATTDLTNSL